MKYFLQQCSTCYISSFVHWTTLIKALTTTMIPKISGLAFSKANHHHTLIDPCHWRIYNAMTIPVRNTPKTGYKKITFKPSNDLGSFQITSLIADDISAANPATIPPRNQLDAIKPPTKPATKPGRFADSAIYAAVQESSFPSQRHQYLFLVKRQTNCIDHFLDQMNKFQKEKK